MELKPNFAIEYAKEFTIIAMQNSMIPRTSDSAITAKNVTTFFNTICDELTAKEASDQ